MQRQVRRLMSAKLLLLFLLSACMVYATMATHARIVRALRIARRLRTIAGQPPHGVR